MSTLKSFSPMKLLKQFHINERHLTLFVIVCVAIVVFTQINRMREGFEEGDGMMNSYTAPAGNTVLYDRDGPGHKHSKKCKHKKSKKGNHNGNGNGNGNGMFDDGPLGIPRSDIPYGDEELYILKSEVIPPVCPACPNVTVCPNCGGDGSGNGSGKAPPPCPPCARCPEPAFDCKKVPNYNSNNSDYLPRPVLADFSQFGM